MTTATVHALLKSAPTKLRDEISRLEQCVRAKLGGRVRSFRIDVDDAGLVLQGLAPTYYVKCLAQHAVMETTNVPIAVNRIEVSSPAPN